MSQLFYITPDSGALTSYNAKDASALLKQDLGIVLQQNQDKSMAEAIADPKTWITGYQTAINGAVDFAGNSMSEYQTKLLSAGVPTERAKAMAMAHASRVFEEAKFVVDLEKPAYGEAIGKLRVDRAALEGTAHLQGAADSEKDVIRKYKARKAAKKASKKSA